MSIFSRCGTTGQGAQLRARGVIYYLCLGVLWQQPEAPRSDPGIQGLYTRRSYCARRSWSITVLSAYFEFDADLSRLQIKSVICALEQHGMLHKLETTVEPINKTTYEKLHALIRQVHEYPSSGRYLDRQLEKWAMCAG